MATLAVVFGHAGSFFGGFSWSQHPSAPYIQSQAVTLFFLVSGYTIAWVCERDAERGNGFGLFVFNRGVRLLVPLVPVLLLIWLIEPLAYSPHPYSQNTDLLTLFGNIGFLQYIEFGLPGTLITTAMGIEPFGTNRPLWTISLEFWIYIAYGGLVFALQARSSLIILVATVCALVAISAISPSLVGGRGAGLPVIWLVGALCYYAFKLLPDLNLRHTLVLLPVGAVVLLMLADRRNWPATGTYTMQFNALIALGFAWLLVAAPQMPIWWNRILGFLGTNVAYTTYLVHYPVLHLLWSKGWLPQGDLGAFSAAVISLIVSYVVSLPFEGRYREVRAWLLRRMSQPPAG